MFQIKDFASITASMINWLRANTTKVTDFNVGSVVRTMAEASAAEMEELYLQYFIGLREAIPVSVFNTFGFPAIAAESASGVIRFTVSTPATSTITIPGGVIVQVPGGQQVYQTLADNFILTGQTYVDILAAAQSPGVAGNTDAGTITELVSSVTGITSITNPQPFINGRDLETDDERKVRFQGYISTLARGTKAAIEYGAKTAKLTNSLGVVTEYVAYAGVEEPWIADPTQPISLVNCYVHNGASATSAGLVNLAQAVINGYFEADGVTPVAGSGWKAAGVKCVVSAAADQPVNVTGVVSVLNGYTAATVIAAAGTAVRAYLQGRNVGTPVQLAEVIAIIKRDVPGVFNVTLSAPTADVSIAANAKAIAGTVTLTAA